MSSPGKDQPLVIKSSVGVTGARQQWTPFGIHLPVFTANIGVGEGGDPESSPPDISKAVSGVPTVFARADLFAKAIRAGGAVASHGMQQFYSQCLDEWKGIISAFVLEPDASSWAVKRIELTYTPKDPTLPAGILNARNIYEPKGAFGKSLFARKQLWEDQREIENPQRVKKPFIDIIYFKGEVVAGTSPESLLFTAPDYFLSSLDKSFISPKGRFSDPIKNVDKLSSLELNQLRNFASNIAKKLGEFYDQFREKSSSLFIDGDIDENVEKLSSLLANWIKDIEFAISKRGDKTDPGARPEVGIFEDGPFKALFNFENLYCANFGGEIVFKGDSDAEAQGFSLEFKPADILLDPAATEVARLALSKSEVDSLPIRVLGDSVSQQTFFSIPLSPLGLRLFQRDSSLEKLLDGNKSSSESTLIALYDPEKNVLKVELALTTRDGKKLSPVVREYPVALESLNPKESKQLVIWPNFCNSLWNKYFLYSEMPHDHSTDWQAHPLLGTIHDTENTVDILFESHRIPNSGGNYSPLSVGEPENLARNGQSNESKYGRLVVGNFKTQSPFKYEIYESTTPYRGIEIKKTGKKGGYILLKYSAGRQLGTVRLISNVNLEPCRVGIDFGSNNTCVAYSRTDNREAGQEHFTEPELLNFRNRRVSFFTTDESQNKLNATAPADTFEMLFFQNDEIRSDKIKSILTIHDQSRLVADGESARTQENSDLQYTDLVKGGFTCHERNIAIRESTDNRHIVRLRKNFSSDVEISIVHSMKWKEKDNKHKIGFLKNVLIQTYAELFDPDRGDGGRYFPKTLLWSYPGAMSSSRINDYRTNVWEQVHRDCNPLVGSSYQIVVKTDILAKNNRRQPPSSGYQTTSRAEAPRSAATDLEQILTGAIANHNDELSLQMGEAKSARRFQDARYPGEIDQKNSWAFTTPRNIPPECVLTESQAVAAWAQATGGKGNYVVGVDVGGSTSDVFVLTDAATNKVLVKQGSLKIAAGVVAESSKLIPGFMGHLRKYAATRKRELGDIYAFQNIDPIGDEQSISPYCLNLILDKLDSEEALNDFYRYLAANCKPLFWINLFITGLTVYYLGMMLRKSFVDIAKFVSNNPSCEIGKPQKFVIRFVGKGSRIYDWFKARDEQRAREYLFECFDSGFGHVVCSGPQRIVYFDLFDHQFDNTQRKSEVARGLAGNRDKLFELVSEDMLKDVSGEDGFILTNVPGREGPVSYGSLMEINATLLQRLGSELVQGSDLSTGKFPKLQAFIQTFEHYAKESFDFSVDGHRAREWIQQLDLVSELERNDEDFRLARSGPIDHYDFSAPLIILEGQAFLRSFLLPEIRRKHS